MSKSATPPTDVMRELRDDELETVSGGYDFTDVMVESFFGGLGDDTLDGGAGRRRFAS